MSNLENLGNRIEVPLSADSDGFLGRECPIESCLGYFKITPGTGIKGPAPCHCPYCGHSGPQDTFFTQEQLEYARSVALRRITDAIHADLKALEFDHKPSGPFGIGISMKVTSSAPYPISYYREKELETEVICDQCTLRYAIYGVFGWCPDCGSHNSLQILSKNLEIAGKELKLAEAAEADLAEYLVGDALENIVSAFDGFGREVCRQRGADIHFQNIGGARKKVQDQFGFDFADPIAADEWDAACRLFQKRHLLAHRMGVVDADYVQRANDPSAVIGRRIRVSRDEVSSAMIIIDKLGPRLFEGIIKP